MALSSCLFTPQIRASFRMNGSRLRSRDNHVTGGCGTKNGVNPAAIGRSFPGGLDRRRNVRSRSGSAVVHASWVQPSSQIASSAFTWGTAAVLPFYALMVMAPRTELTKTVAASSVPYVLLGMLYAYLLCLSWTPDTIQFIFASKYWLPELPGIATMFSSEMTLASAWIHLLAVDLFAARQVYLDGLKESVQTRHSVLLCLLFCPIGILTHIVTKAVATGKREKT